MGSEEEECDDCVPDTEALLKEKKLSFSTKHRDKPKPERSPVLIFITRGTYAHADDLFSAVHVGNATLAKRADASIILLNDGVYCAVDGQDPEGISLPPVTKLLSDFLELGGNLYAMKESLENRGLGEGNLIQDIETITNAQVVEKIKEHNVTVTF